MRFIDPSGMEGEASQGNTPTVWYYTFTTNALGLSTATSSNEPSKNDEDIAEKIRELIRKHMGDKGDHNYREAVDKIRDNWASEFKLKLNQIWNYHFSDNVSVFNTDVYEDAGVLTGYTDFGSQQFTDFANEDEGFGDLVRNIYHEYQHVENGYAANGESNMDHELDEFTAHYNTLKNTVLPAYSPAFAKAYTQAAEGYYNAMPSELKTRGFVPTDYYQLIHALKPAVGLPAVASPSQLPPPIYRRDSNGKPKNIYTP